MKDILNHLRGKEGILLLEEELLTKRKIQSAEHQKQLEFEEINKIIEELLKEAEQHKNKNPGETEQRYLMEIYGFALALSQVTVNPEQQKLLHSKSAELIEKFVGKVLNKPIGTIAAINLPENISTLKSKLDNLRLNFDMKKQHEENQFELLRKNFGDLFKDIFHYALDLIGEPPTDCRYVPVGLGSWSTECITPYSDLEYFILVEPYTDKVVTYFKNLAQIIELISVSLGESPIIQAKAALEKYKAYFNYLPSGLRLDEHKQPQDNNRKIGLVNSPQGIVEQLTDKDSIIHKAGNHLTSALFTTKLFEGLGDEKLYQTFQQLFNKALPTQDYANCLKELLKQDIRSCEGLLSADLENPWKLKQVDYPVNLKKLFIPFIHLPRQLLLLARALGESIELAQTPEAILSALFKAKIIDEKTYQTLKTITHNLFLLRLKLQVENKSSKAQITLSKLNEQIEIQKIIDCLNSLKNKVKEYIDKQPVKSLATLEAVIDETIPTEKFWRVPGLNPNFTGRVELLKTLHKKLNQTQQHVVAITALHGLGGIGKTQLAIKYIYEHHRDYKKIFWISAETVDRLLADYRTLAETFKLPIEGKDPEGIAEQVKRFLENQSNNPWLIVYDNVEDPKLIETYKPRQGGTVLVTSRRSDWPGVEKLAIDVFSLEEARAYIVKITGVSLEQHQAKIDELANTLGKLPLALAQACAYISVQKITLQDYLKLYEENRQAMLADKTMPLEAQHESVAVTWHITFIEIEKQNPAASMLLGSCAYLSSDHLQEFLLKALFNEQQPESANQLKPFLEAIGCLQQYSLLKQTAAAEENIFMIHKLVQEVIIDSLPEEIRKDYLLTTIRMIKNLYPYKSDPQLSDYIRQRHLLPHLEKNLSEADAWLKALKQASEVDEGQTALFSKIEEVLLDLLILIANGHGNLGEAFKKKEYLERALFIKEKHYGRDHVEVAKTLVNLGNAYGALGNAHKQKEYLERALEIQEKHYGPAHVQVAKTLTNLGNAYGDLGNAHKKKEYLERALEIQEKHYGRDHVEVARTLGNLGNAYGDLGNAHKRKSISNARWRLKKSIMAETT